MVKILCIIPARSGSKGIKNKNIKLYNGKPLLQWSIEQALNSTYKMKIIVSTDSEEYRNIAISLGADAPFLRPNEISGDLSTDYECFRHSVEWLQNNENYVPDIILHLRPTSPTRKCEDIDKALKIFIEQRHLYDSLRSVIESDKSPYKMYNLIDNELVPLFKKVEDIIEPFNQCRQILPKAYLHNGYIDIFNCEILKNNSISGERIYPYIMNNKDNIDIDLIKDWVL
jgi:CMP-N-acetylneuraminic acid synthetase